MIKLLLVALTGWVGGIIVNYLADTLPIHRRLNKPFCSHCLTPMKLNNYIFWPRYCSSCKRRRSWRSYLVEIFYITSSVWLWMSRSEQLPFILGYIILLYFGLLTVIDLEHRLILHTTSIFGVFLGFGAGIWHNGIIKTLIGGLAGFGVMFLLYLMGILFIKVSTRLRGGTAPEEALGFGDVNLSGVIGLIVGWPNIFVCLIFTILLSGAFSAIYILVLLFVKRYKPNIAIPYGPFLIISATSLIFFSNLIQSIIN